LEIGGWIMMDICLGDYPHIVTFTHDIMISKEIDGTTLVFGH